MDSVAGFSPTCCYYRRSFIDDFKRSYLAFTNLGPENPIDWVEVLITPGLDSSASFFDACTKRPLMSFRDSISLVINFMQANLYWGMGMGMEMPRRV